MVATLLAIAALPAYAGHSQTANPGDYRSRFPLPGLTFGDGWGVNLGPEALTAVDLSRLREAGFKWVRRDLAWQNVEHTKGKYDWSYYDRMMEMLRPAGIRPVFILDYGNDHYQTGAPRIPEARAAFVKFATAAVLRYRGRGVVWEMWNEPNHPQFWLPAVNAQEYSTLANETGQAIRRVAAEEWVVGPATSGIDLKFLEACFQAGTLRYWDAITVHPYRGSSPETVTTEYGALRAILRKYSPDRDLPILSGEWGYSNQEGGLSGGQQADYFARQYLVNVANRVPMSIWYNFADSGANPKDPEHRFGLLSLDRRPKPAWDRLQLQKLLAGYRYRLRFRLDRSEDWVLLFSKEGRPALVAWTAGTPRNVRVGGLAVKLTSTPQVIVPEARSAFLDAAQELPSLPLTLTVGQPAEAARWVRSVVASAPAGSQVTVRWPVPLLGERSVVFRGQTELSDAEPLVQRVANGVLRGEDPVEFRVEVRSPGADPVVQSTQFLPLDPLRFDFVSGPAGRVSFRLEGTVKGSVRLLLDAISHEFPAEGPLVTGSAPVAKGSPQPIVNAVVLEQNRAVLITSALRLHRLGFGETSPAVEGNPDVAGSAVWREESSASDPAGPARTVAYDFATGWKYALLGSDGTEITRTADRYGVWVRHSGGPVNLTFRFTDAKGETFQGKAQRLEASDWRWVSWSLRPNETGQWVGGSWGGDGVVDYPIRWRDNAVVDSPGSATKGELRLAGPMVTTDQSP